MVALFVAITFISFIVIDIFILRAKRKKHTVLESTAMSPVFSKRSFELPEEIYVSAGHTYLRPLKGGNVVLGLDDFAVKSLGDVLLSSPVQAGQNIKKGDVLFEVQVRHRRLNFYSPVDGVVKSRNERLMDARVTDAYEDWGIEVEPNNMEESIKLMKKGHDLSVWLKDEFARLKDFLSQNAFENSLVGATMHDGGHIAEGAAAYLSDESLNKLEKEFFSL